MTVRRDGAAAVASVRDRPASDILWGAATLVQGGTTYFYGTRIVDAHHDHRRQGALTREVP